MRKFEASFVHSNVKNGGSHLERARVIIWAESKKETRSVLASDAIWESDQLPKCHKKDCGEQLHVETTCKGAVVREVVADREVV